ncbi:MAG: S-layer homology domain-containing protein, partial [Eubacteriales bacterium]|nr:S-layer homology domain-containing protein [Eubacteriales bacterium]
MKRDNRQVIVFILVLTLTFSCFIPQASALEDGSSVTAGVSNAEKPLKDVKGHWGEGVIQKAIGYGFVQGYNDGTFRPDKPVSRAEFVTMVNKALKLRAENTQKLLYSDVRDSDWFNKEIQKASYARYVSGIDESTFMPMREITRQEAAVMLARILPKDGSVSDQVLNGYKDADQISPWAKSAVAMVVGKSYLSGYSPDKLGPKATLSRAEAAKIIGLILDKETIVREDVSVKSANETLKGKIYVGDITIEKSVGEGDAALENITALSKVYVIGGGTNTIKVSNSTIIQLVICKEGTKVRVLSGGETSIYNAFVFNGNYLADIGEGNAETGAGSYFTVIRVNGSISAEIAIRIADEIAKQLDSSGQISQVQLKAALAAVTEGYEISIDSNGSLEVNLPKNIQIKNKNGSGSDLIYLTINGKTATLSNLGGSCPCGLSFTSPGAFTKMITFYPSGDAANTVTAFAIYTEAQLQHLAMHPDSNAFLMNDLDFTEYANGSGDMSAPMGALKIADQAGLYTAGYDISDFETGKFVPIGTQSHPYNGNFYGNGKVISGLIVSCGSITGIGLFGFTSGAAINGLTVSGGSITGDQAVGAIVGAARGGTIEHCRNSAAVTGSYGVGGVAGVNYRNDILNSGNTGSVLGEESVGGVVGSNEKSDILNSGNTGSVSGDEEVGGVGGYNRGDVGGMENCFNTGAVSGTDCVGGVAGYASYISPIRNTYNTGVISGSEHVGGVVGDLTACTILTSYNTGIYSGNNYVGGGVGYCEDDSDSNCYWLEGLNASGIGESSVGAETAFHDSDPALAGVYSRIAAIASSNGIDVVGAVSRIDFGNGDMIPFAFNPLQGSYTTSASSLMITISAISGTSITVESGTSLSEIISSGGIVIEPTVLGGNVYDLESLSPGTWVLIKAVNEESAKTRYYTLFIKPTVDTMTIMGNPAVIATVTDSHCSCGLPLSSPGAFTKEVIFYPDSEAVSTIKGVAIYTEAQLQHLAVHRNSDAILMNDLDFSQYEAGSSDPATPMGALKAAEQAGLYTGGHDINGFETGKFVPIGYSDSRYSVGQAYTGSFYGNGKVISGLTVNSPLINYIGLFGYTYQADITDVTISGGSITGKLYVGAVAGMTYGGSIDNCSNSAAVS